jgi:23S rRNA (adenine-N6)-dimethyltransferase
MRKSILYSQNFLINKSLVSKLIGNSSIVKEDVVYEIGAGTGIITDELIKKCQKVVAFELENNLYQKLNSKYKNEKRIKLFNKNFLDYSLPVEIYKVFSNIPFNITSDIIKKLTLSENCPIDAFLVVQKEAAYKFIGKPFIKGNSQIAILIKPWFNLEIIHNFNKSDFLPKPNIDIVLLRIVKKDKPDIEYKQKNLYQDFVSYTFNQFKPNRKPSEIDYNNWISLFNEFAKLSSNKKLKINGFYKKLLKQQSKLSKIHRTRNDKDWRKKEVPNIVN